MVVQTVGTTGSVIHVDLRPLATQRIDDRDIKIFCDFPDDFSFSPFFLALLASLAVYSPNSGRPADPWWLTLVWTFKLPHIMLAVDS